jgi:SWI/SNF-related matrix-associated actin-dependent regulator of chromatin subfamily A member 5
LSRQLETDNAEAASTGSDWKKLASLLMQLRKCCNHPFLFPGVEPSADEAYSQQLIDGSVRATASAPPRLRASAPPRLRARAPVRPCILAALHPAPLQGKFQLLERLLAKLFSGGHRVVLFSQFTSTLDLLEDFLTHKESCSPTPCHTPLPCHTTHHATSLATLHTPGLTLTMPSAIYTPQEYKYCRLDGSTNRVQRTVDINSFNMPGSSRFVFLMSTRAGGLGINCQTADTW